jgi:hypothetical protein
VKEWFVWGHIKQLVYAEPVNSEEELRLRVEDAARMFREMTFGMSLLIECVNRDDDVSVHALITGDAILNNYYK